MPTRDRRATLARALAGVQGQRYRDFELVVVDDGSTDGTADWLRSSIPEVRLVAAPRSSGAASARNLGLAHARGELIAFLDDDDVWLPAYLEAQVGHLDANPGALLSYADHMTVDSAGRRSHPDLRSLVPAASPLARLLAEGFIHTMSVVVCRRDAFDRFGGFDPGLTIVHDLEWYARVLDGGGRFVHLPRTLAERSVPGGLVTSHRHWFREEHAVIANALDRNGELRPDRRMIRAYRSLLFARVALPKGDLSFGLARLADALVASPRWTVQLSSKSLLRRARRRPRTPAEPWPLPAEVSP